MRVPISARLFAALSVALLGSWLLPGCGSQPDTGSADSQTAEERTTDSRTAEEIYSALRSRYASCRSYSDRAVLYLSYRLDGKAMHESLPWALQYDRDAGFLAELFNAFVTCDGQQISCFVYDIDSGNLNGQQLIRTIHAEDPWQTVWSDPIARHFLAGSDDLPLASSLDETGPPALVPPTIGLLNGQNLPSWLAQPERITRMADDNLDGHACYVIRLEGKQTWDLWIDRDTLQLWQMLLPIDLLDARVQIANEVDQVQLVARFHNGKFDAAIDPEQLTVAVREKAIPVREFVRIPEPLPSELIGQQANDFQLLTGRGQPVKRDDLGDRTTALFWAIGPGAKDIAARAATLASELDRDDWRFAIVVSDAELTARPPAQWDVQPEILSAIPGDSPLEVLVDLGLDATSQLRVDQVPALLVLDRGGQVCYATTLPGETWTEAAATALTRIAAGDDLAAEMLADYERFLENYHEKISEQRLDRPSGIAAQQVSTSRIRELPAQLRWSLSELTRPGNLVGPLGDEGDFWVFDGWRTLARINSKGELLRREVPELPPNEAVNQLRIGTDKTGNPCYALFNRSGQRVFFYDSQWQAIGEFPMEGQSLGPVAECHWSTGGDAAPPNAWIAFAGEGLIQFEPAAGSADRVDGRSATGFSPLRDALLSNGELVALGGARGELPSAINREYRWRLLHGEGDRLLAIVEDREQQTWALQLSGNWNVDWRIPIDSPQTATESNVIAAAAGKGRNTWGVLLEPTRIRMFSDRGTWLGDFTTPTPIQGFGLSHREGKASLLVSSGEQVDCWEWDLDGTVE